MSTHRSSTFIGTWFVVLTIIATLSSAAGAQDRQEERATYVLGVNDQLTIMALDADEISGKSYRVGSEGEITVPMIGRFKVAGMTAEQLESALASALERYIRYPKLAV